MSFGIPGSETSSGGNGEFIGRMQFDARTGMFKHYTRTETPTGYENVESELYTTPTVLLDFGSIEVGYARISNPPVFLLVPYLGAQTAFPVKPPELNAEGKAAFQSAVRIKVMSSLTFGDSEPRYFMLASKTGLPSMEEAYKAFQAAPEAARGMVPVASIGTRTVEVKTPQGVSKFKVPVFSFTQWVQRPEALGERLVPAPVPKAGAAPAAPRAAPVAPPVNHVPPPAAAKPIHVSVPWGEGAGGGGGGGGATEEALPFAPEFR